MLILGWITNDYRGRKHWAAFWSADDTPALRAQAMRHSNDQGLDARIFVKCDDVPIEIAKAEVRNELCAF